MLQCVHMKRIRLIVEEFPNDRIQPELIGYKYKPVKLEPLSDIAPMSVEEPEKIIYRHQMFAYGRDYIEHFYITDEDFKAFEGLFHEFIKRGRLSLMKQIQEYLLEDDENYLSKFLQQLIDKEEEA